VRSQPNGIRGSDGHGASGEQRRSRGKCGWLLCYVLGWLTGIIFILIDKRPFVRFHAAQSIVVFGALMVLRIGFGVVAGIEASLDLVCGPMVSMVLGLLTVILWILLMIKAYQHELFRVPIAAPIADGIAGK